MKQEELPTIIPSNVFTRRIGSGLKISVFKTEHYSDICLFHKDIFVCKLDKETIKNISELLKEI